MVTNKSRNNVLSWPCILSEESLSVLHQLNGVAREKIFTTCDPGCCSNICFDCFDPNHTGMIIKILLHYDAAEISEFIVNLFNYFMMKGCKIRSIKLSLSKNVNKHWLWSKIQFPVASLDSTSRIIFHKN